MVEREENAKIVNAFLGFEDHGILTVCITVEGDGWGQSFGGYGFGSASQPVMHPFGMEFIRQLLLTLEVNSWSELQGLHVRIRSDHSLGKIHAIGHIVKDKWFNPSELSVS